MLVTNPQNRPYLAGWVVVFAYMLDEEDAPSFTAWAFENMEAAIERLKDFGVEEEAWREIPDQLPGCQDDWIAAVRIARAPDGSKLYKQWEQLVDGEWVLIDGQTGGFGNCIRDLLD